MAFITKEHLLAECGGDEQLLLQIQRELVNELPIKSLLIQENNLKKAHMLVQANQVHQQYLQAVLGVIKAWKKDNLKKANKVKLAHVGFGQEERSKIALLCVSIAMCADFVETYSMDIDEILKKYEPETNFLTFQPFRECLKGARETLEWLNQNTDLYKYESWGNECDDLIKMIQSKARKLIKKSNERVDAEVERKRKEIDHGNS